VPVPTARLPVAVVGAGPVGLAAAAHLLERGLVPLVLEAGDQPGANIARWRHVRLFTPWCLALDPAALRLLATTGWTPPDPDALPTGAELIDGYLRPLAATPALAAHLRLGSTVVGIARQDLERRVLVVGAGHSAATSLLALAELRRRAPGTQILWAVRSATPRPLVGKGSARADELSARGQLAADLRALVDAGQVELVSGFRIRALEPHPHGVTVVGHGPAGPRHVHAEQIVNATGFRPDHAIAQELRLALDPALESVAALAPLIDPNVHTCGSVPAHGACKLAHADRGYYIAGMKSYGRAPTFLLATGYEQVRSVAAALAGDRTVAAVPPGPPTARFCRVTHELLHGAGARSAVPGR